MCKISVPYHAQSYISQELCALLMNIVLDSFSLTANLRAVFDLMAQNIFL